MSVLSFKPSLASGFGFKLACTSGFLTMFGYISSRRFVSNGSGTAARVIFSSFVSVFAGVLSTDTFGIISLLVSALRTISYTAS